MQAALEDLLDISLQNLLAIDGSLGLNLLGRVLADVEENRYYITLTWGFRAVMEMGNELIRKRKRNLVPLQD